MPPLKSKTDLFPPELFDLGESEFPWWVAHTRSRQDKVLARHLLKFSVPFYLPQQENRYRRAGRSLVSFLPLFPGYVFFRGAERERYSVLKSNVVVRTLPVHDQKILAEELRQLRRFQEAGASLIPFVCVVSGDTVRVIEGPFKGHFGVVLREAGRLRLIVSVSMLCSSVAVEFPREVLSKFSSRENPRSAVGL